MYEGIKNNNSRKLLSKIDIQSLNLLIDELIDIYFFALDDQYTLNSDKNTPLIILSVKWQGKFKKVVYDNNSKVPAKLIEFQKLIEQTVGVHK